VSGRTARIVAAGDRQSTFQSTLAVANVVLVS
jgi:hypothetical protein